MRKLQLNSFRELTVLLLIATASLTSNSKLTAQCDSGTIGGSVFEDIAADGIINGSDQGVANVIVELHGPSGLVANTQTNTDGRFLFNGLNDGDTYRLEFVKPLGFNQSWLGTDNGSDVQFVNVPNCDASYGLTSSDGGCTSESTMYLTCFVNGGEGQNESSETIVGLKYGFNQSSSVAAVANKGETGSIWGLAYKASTNQLFSAAFIKQYAQLTEHGHDAIFITDLNGLTPTTQLFTKLSDLGISAGNLTYSDPTDCDYKTQVGRVGLGSMVISPDGQYIYVVNIGNNSIVKISTVNPTADNTVEIPLLGLPCSGGQQKLFALKYHEDKLWIGSTCTAEFSQNESNSSATVVSYDINTNSFDLEFSTNYIKGFWNDDIASFQTQHWFTDIDFTDDGNMLLSLTDRVGHAYCNPDQPRADYQNPDLLMVWNDNGTWRLENNGSAGSLVGIGVNNGQGPGNGEFFGFDYWISDPVKHPETALGSILVMPGTNSVVAAVYDPLAAAYSGGLHMYNTSNGTKMSSIQLYDQSYTINFGKSTGFGDIVAACGMPAMEIGNLVWEDTNYDGMQTPGEPVLAGISVCLYNCDYEELACTTTDANGYYIFNHNTSSSNPNYSGIEANACYFVGLNPTQYDNGTNSYLINGTHFGPSMDPTSISSPGVETCTNTNSDFVEVSVNGGTQLLAPVLTADNGESMHCIDLGLSPITEFDLALSKELIGNTTPRQDDNVQFLITVRNEGVIDAERFTVSDDLQDGFSFDPGLNPGWSLTNTTISYKDNTPLAVGATRSYMVTLGLKTDQSYNYRNIAEISEAMDMLGNDDSDVDSTPDDDFTNDAPSEDDIDDATVKIFDLALISTLEDPTKQYKAKEYVRVDIDVWNQGTLAADAVSVITYYVDGLSFVPVLNPNWVFNGTGFVNSSIGTIAAGQKKTVSIHFQIDEDKTEGTLEVYSEITKASSLECPGAVDFDSYPDQDNENDQGGVPGSPTDNVLDGNGSTDEDDHDPVQIKLNFLDLALMKTADSHFAIPGEDAVFKITVFNQGTESVGSVILADYLPENTSLVSSDWTLVDAQTATKEVVFPTPLKSGESHTEYITLNLDLDIDPQILVNYAEIAQVFDVNDADISEFDVDSNPDTNPLNDVGGVLGQPSDDMVNGDPSIDEDDHDPVGIAFGTITASDCECQLNATEPGNGWFTRTITIEAPSNQEWRLFEAVHFYDYAASGPDVTDLVEFTTGPASMTLSEGFNPADGISNYTLTGIHIDGEPFFVRFVNDELDVFEYPGQAPGAACDYEAPVIEGEFAVCEGSTITYSVPFEADCDFDWELINDMGVEVDDFDGNDIDITWTYPAGLYTLRMSKDCDDEACITPVSRVIDLGTTGGQISCIGDINVSLGVDCMLEITPGMILAGDPDPNAAYEVILMDYKGDIIPNNILTNDHLWTTVTAKLIDGCSGNSCWGTINVEDKVAPKIDCSDAEVFCHKMEDYLPIVDENCGNYTIELIGETSDSVNCDDTYIKEVYRTYKAIDEYGNESEPCTQKINVLRIPFDSIVFPPDFKIADMTALECSDVIYDEFDHPSVDQTMVPTLDGHPLYPIPDEVYCRLGINYTDYEIETGDCTKKFMRRWVIYEDHCSTGGIDSIHVQTIEIIDLDPPIIYCPDETEVMKVSINNPYACEANVTMPHLHVEDECSEPVTVTMSYGFGPLVNSNGGLITGLPIGLHPVTYTATDQCGRKATCVIYVEVIDAQPPVAQCDYDMIIGLRSDGTAEAYAGVFNEGSYDNCYIDSMAVRRLDGENACFPEDTVWSQKINFCCDDISTMVPIEFAVWDKNGNISICELEVEVQDKTSPVVLPPLDLYFECEDFNDIEEVAEETAMNLSVINECADTTLNIITEIISDNCNQTIYHVTYEVSDTPPTPGIPNTASVSHNVTVTNTNHFDLMEVVFPADIMITNNVCSEIDYSPEALGMPTFVYAGCDLVAVAPHVDHKFVVEDNDNTCFKIVRKWTVINYCTEQDTTYDQTISVINSEAPEIVDVDVEESYPSTNNCEKGRVMMSATAEDECTDQANLTWEIYIDGDFYNTSLGGIAIFDDSLSIGQHFVTFSFTDECSNTISVVREFEVTNNVGPEIACVGQVFVGLVPWDTDGDLIADTDYACIGIDSLIASASHLCDEDLIFSFNPDTDINDPSTIQDTICFDCEDRGMNEVEVYVFDEDGQFASCTVIVTVESNSEHTTCSNFDLALIKTIDVDESVLPASIGENIMFDIKIFNQGGTTVDSVEVVDYIPAGMTFNPALNDLRWNLDGDMATISLGEGDMVLDSMTIPNGGLLPEGCFNIPIVLTVNENAEVDNMTNIAEIKTASDIDGNANDDDADSTPDMIPDNDGTPDDDNPNPDGGDEDDHDPETVPFFDLALVKVLVDNQSIEIGEELLFDITIFNQGNEAASMVDIVDYIPCGFSFDENTVVNQANGWTAGVGSTASATYEPTIDPGSNVTIQIELILQNTDDNCTLADDPWLNFAEISGFEDPDGEFDDPNDDLDIDSTPDEDDDNDGTVTDNELNGNNDDEDDHDPANVDIFDLALIKVADEPSTSYYVGETASFIITVHNQGNLTAEDIVVTDYIPARLSYSSTNNAMGWTELGGNAQSDPFDLAPGASINLSIDLVVESSVGASDEYCNFAEITDAAGEGGAVVNDIDSNEGSNTITENAVKPGDPGDNDLNSDGTDGNQDDHDPATITVCPELEVVISPDTPEICENDSVVLTANVSPLSADVTFEWSTGETTQSISVSPATTSSFSVTITSVDNTDCEYSDDVTVTVNPNPDITAVVTTLNPVCDNEGEDVILNVDGAPANATFSWTTTSSNGFTSNQQNPTVTTDAMFADAGVYTVVVTSEDGCESSASVELVVEDCTCPLMLTLTDNGPYCDGENVNITSNLIGGVGDEVYVWAFNGNTIIGENDPDLTDVVAQTGTYSLNVSSAMSDCEVTEFINVVVNDQPEIDAEVTTDNPVCIDENEAITLLVTGVPNGATISWTTTAANGFTSNQENPTVTNNAMPEDAGLYTVEVTLNGCTDDASVEVVTEDCSCPLMVDLTDNGPYCDGENVNITSSVSGGAGDETFTWAFNGVEIVGEDGPDLTDVVAQAGTYTLTVASVMLDCEATGMVVVTVNDLPECTDPDNVSVCEGDELTLVIDNCTPGSTIVWTAPDGTMSTGSVFEVTDFAEENDAGVYDIEITSTDGCEQVYELTVSVVNEECPTFMDENGLICYNFEIDEDGNAVVDALIDELIQIYADSICSGIDAIVILSDLGCNTNCEAFSTIQITTGTGTELECNIMLEAEDNIDPVLICPPAGTIFCDDIDTFKEAFMSYDNCGPGTENNPVPATEDQLECIFSVDGLQLTVIYTVNDGNGNEASCTVTMDIEDGPCDECPAELVCETALIEGIDCDDGAFVDLFDLLDVADSNCCSISNENLVFTNTAGDILEGFNQFIPAGIDTIFVTGTDDCENEISCEFPIVAVDSLSIRCNKVIIELEDDCTITLNVDAFGTVVVACGGDVVFDFEYLSYDPVDDIDFMTWGSMDPFNDPINQNIYFNIYFETIFGPDSCEAIIFLTVDPMSDCFVNNAEGVVIGGQIYNELGTMISGIDVGLEGSDAENVLTNEFGFYAFPDMPMGGSYEVMPLKDDLPLNGVSTLDLIKIQRHVLGNGTLDSPYKLIAADVNRSNNVTGIDIIELRKLILGIYPTFPQNTSWRMVDATHIFADQNDPFLYPIPESYSVEFLQDNMFIDFIGVKVGDVTDNASTNLDADELENRSNNIAALEVDLQVTGELNSAIISIPETDEFLGLQMSLTYDASELVIEQLEVHESLVPYFGYYDNNGTVHISLALGAELDPVMLNNLIRIDYSGKADRPFEISNTSLSPELYETYETSTIELDYRDANTNSFAVAQNHPNPWTSNTSINVFLPEAGNVNMEVFNAQGQLVLSKTVYFDAGSNVINMNANELAGSGVYHYKLSSGKSSVTKRFLLIE